MGTMLEDLLALQVIETKLSQVRRRLKTRQNAIAIQEQKKQHLHSDLDALNEQTLTKRKRADGLSLDLSAREEAISKLRSALNTARTNKEYASILTQINTQKADNAQLEEDTLKTMAEVDSLKAQAGQINERIDVEESRLQEIRQENSQEVARLTAMLDDLSDERTRAATSVPAKVLIVFDRVAGKYDGEAMAALEMHGRKPPLSYTCGGCFMGLNAEHANALGVRDEIRVCDNCGRILYMQAQIENSHT